LGLRDRISRLIPSKISFESFGLSDFKARSIVAGSSHTIALDFDNNGWTFGSNEKGQLGLGHRSNMQIPTKIPQGLRPEKLKFFQGNLNQ
jgi:alpha-tubulin suppressor-like RCC1 family protein